jgi:magnesium transporter
MIRAKLLIAEELSAGGAELIESWRGKPGSRLWLDVEGELTADIDALLRAMGCDELAILDASRVRHPPKVEEFENNTFVLFRGISSLGADLQLTPQQLALFVGNDFLVTLHRGQSVSINHFWKLVDGKSRHLADTGLLCLQILHFAGGRYLESILDFEDRLGELEDVLLSGEAEKAMKELVAYRSRLRILRRIFNYHQRLAEHVLNGTGRHLDPGGEDGEHYHQRRDLYDRCERLYSLCNMYYEICGDLVEGYISLSSHRLNNTMKVLTIITAIFVPLSFLAGLYGMNFENMPELHYRYGYFFVLGLMAVVALAMITLFRRIRWL